MEEKWYTVKEIAKLLKLNDETVRRAIQRGNLRSAKFGKVYRVSQIDLEAYINNAKEQGLCNRKQHGGKKVELAGDYEGNNAN
jgi:excisionase family DNA binding protein